MKLRLTYTSLALSLVMLSGCGGSGLAGGSGDDVDPLVPEQEEEFVSDGPRPPENAAVITSDSARLYDVSGAPVLLRGVNLQYADYPGTRVNSFAAIRETGANIVRIQLKPDTSADQLNDALEAALANNLVAMVSLEDSEELACMEDDDTLIENTTNLWLNRWLSVLADARFQSHLMINIANEWGPLNIWNANSIGYDRYVDTYKIMIRRFRAAGFKVPLVIDAPHCGEDYNAFLAGRGRELKAADTEQNLVLSVHAFGSRWNSNQELSYALESLGDENVPFLVTEFGGSRVYGDNSINHMDLILQGAGDHAMIFDFPWASDEDVARYSTTLSEVADFSEGAGIDFELYLANSYKVDGKLGVRVLLTDTHGATAKLGLVDISNMDGDAWNNFNLLLDDLADFTDVDDNFDLSAVSGVGLEFSANGKQADLAAEIMIDNITVGIVAGEPNNALLENTFDTDEEGWAWGYGTGDASSVSQNNGALELLAPWDADNTGTQVGVPIGGYALDLSQPISLSVDIYVPNEYADEDMHVQFFFNGNGYTGYAGFGYSTALVAGQWNTLSVDINDFAADAGYISDSFDTSLAPSQVGVDIGGIASAKTEPLRYDNFRLSVREAVESLTLYETSFNTANGWIHHFGAGDESSLNAVDGALQILPPWGGSDVSVALGFSEAASLNPVIDFDYPLTLSMDVFVPASYSDETGMSIQFVFADYNWSGFAGIGYRQISSNDMGDWFTVSMNITDIAEQAGYIDDSFVLDNRPQLVGLQLSGVTTAKTEPVLIDNFSVETIGGAQVPDNIVLDLLFDTASQVDAFLLTSVDGPAWVDTSLDNAKRRGFGLDPFGWIAWSWFGSSEGEGSLEGALDLSNSEDQALLTQRGIEIVDSEFGIALTASDVAFE